MRLESAFRVLFFVYCLEAGLFLTVLPWSASWNQLAWSVPTALLHGWLTAGALRGAISGFGLCHLLWALHDLDAYLRRATAR